MLLGLFAARLACAAALRLLEPAIAASPAPRCGPRQCWSDLPLRRRQPLCKCLRDTEIPRFRVAEIQRYRACLRYRVSNQLCQRYRDTEIRRYQVCQRYRRTQMPRCQGRWPARRPRLPARVCGAQLGASSAGCTSALSPRGEAGPLSCASSAAAILGVMGVDASTFLGMTATVLT